MHLAFVFFFFFVFSMRSKGRSVPKHRTCFTFIVIIFLSLLLFLMDYITYFSKFIILFLFIRLRLQGVRKENEKLSLIVLKLQREYNNYILYILIKIIVNYNSSDELFLNKFISHMSRLSR